MDARSIGLVRPLAQVQSSQLVLFQYAGGLEPGIVVNLYSKMRGVMHLRAKVNGRAAPEIYTEDGFQNESVIHIENARIVPSFNPESCGSGYHNGGNFSSALYIDADAVYLFAKFKYNRLAINLFNGQAVPLDHYDLFYTREWKIEVPNGELDFQDYMEFSVGAEE